MCCDISLCWVLPLVRGSYDTKVSPSHPLILILVLLFYWPRLAVDFGRYKLTISGLGRIGGKTLCLFQVGSELEALANNCRHPHSLLFLLNPLSHNWSHKTTSMNFVVLFFIIFDILLCVFFFGRRVSRSLHERFYESASGTMSTKLFSTGRTRSQALPLLYFITYSTWKEHTRGSNMIISLPLSNFKHPMTAGIRWLVKLI